MHRRLKKVGGEASKVVNEELGGVMEWWNRGVERRWSTVWAKRDQYFFLGILAFLAIFARGNGGRWRGAGGDN